VLVLSLRGRSGDIVLSYMLWVILKTSIISPRKRLYFRVGPCWLSNNAYNFRNRPIYSLGDSSGMLRRWTGAGYTTVMIHGTIIRIELNDDRESGKNVYGCSYCIHNFRRWQLDTAHAFSVLCVYDFSWFCDIYSAFLRFRLSVHRFRDTHFCSSSCVKFCELF